MLQVKSTKGSEDLYLEGLIMSSSEDAEGGTYDPSKVNLGDLLENGYLDVNHIMFNYGEAEAVIGKPVEVKVIHNGIWARFRLASSQLAKDIYEYVQKHPGRLGLSIAGRVKKGVFDKGGDWDLDSKYSGSIGISRSPKNALTYVATSRLGGDIANVSTVMYQLAVDLNYRTVQWNQEYGDWYDYFKKVSGGDAFVASSLAAWATRYFKMLAIGQDAIEGIKNVVVYSTGEEASVRSSLTGKIVSWLAVHPDDSHFSSDGKFRSVEDANAHYRYCEGLSPDQVATIMGFLRGNTDLLSRIPVGWEESTTIQH